MADIARRRRSGHGVIRSGSVFLVAITALATATFVEAATLTYDANGNLISKDSTGQSTSYTFLVAWNWDC